MKLIKPYYEIIKPTGYTIDDIYKSIELVGRVCYKSEDKITEDSAKPFVDRMIKSSHGSILEHGTVYLQFFWPGAVCQRCNQTAPYKLLDKYADNKYSIVRYHGNDIYVTTNLRVLVENEWLDDLKYLCEPTEYHEKRVCVRFICDRVTGESFLRHRVFSFARESTRYCNYFKDKFNHEITFIEPLWLYNEWSNDANIAKDYFRQACEQSEMYYFSLLKEGWKPQQARAVLPFCIKSPLIMTGFVRDWKHFFKLRDDKQHAHPQAYELAHPLHEEFIKLGLLKE